jgi:transcriptional regulator GlxA family with amidase domain
MPICIEFLPHVWQGGRMPSDVAVLVWDGVAPFELGVLCEAWGVDRREHGVPLLDFAVCGPAPQATTSMGFTITLEHGMDRAATADLVAVPATDRHRPVPAGVIEVLQAAADRGARVLSVCSGAFALGEAGLLDGRQCTTHWMYTEELAARFPRSRVVPEVLFVDTGVVVTSAGSAAGLDACLHVWREDHGAATASAVARRMVVPPQRDGGQAQFIRSAVPSCEGETLGPLLTWMVEHLDEPMTVPSLARASAMSERTFARRFRAETGTTPHAWLTRQRVLRAEELLETTQLPVERIAEAVGFGAPAVLRHHFTRARGVSPQQYRRRFGRVAG